MSPICCTALDLEYLPTSLYKRKEIRKQKGTKEQNRERKQKKRMEKRKPRL